MRNPTSPAKIRATGVTFSALAGRSRGDSGILIFDDITLTVREPEFAAFGCRGSHQQEFGEEESMEVSPSPSRPGPSFAHPFTVLIFALLLSSLASAVPLLPPPDYGISVSAGSSTNFFTVPGSYVLGGASIDVLGTPGVSFFGRASGNPTVGAGFSGGVNYSFAVSGPQLDVLVPVFVSFKLHASVTGTSLVNATAFFYINTVQESFSEQVDADGTHPNPMDIVDTRPLVAISGRIGMVSLSISGASFNGLAEASADPFIFIDPVFLASNPGYSVSVSPGIGNAPPVPEPGADAMLLFGLALVAFRRRRSAGHDRKHKR